MSRFDVIVVGDGAIGLCTAYYLVKAGVRVGVVTNSDANRSDNCSYGNAGMIVPSHFTPLAAPGAVKQGVKWIFNAKSPLFIRPRFNRELADWLWKFYRSSNQYNVDTASSVLYEMNVESKHLFQLLSKDEGVDFEMEQRGLMMLYQSLKCQEEEETLALKAQNFGIET